MESVAIKARGFGYTDAHGGAVMDDDSALWDEYRRTKSDTSRNAIIMANVQVIDYHASMLHSKLRAYSELFQDGVIGMCTAIGKFSKSRHTAFKTFAGKRVRGQMLDQRRNDDQLSRSSRAKFWKIKNTKNAFYAKHGRNPTDAELMRIMSVNKAMLSDMMACEQAGEVMAEVETHDSEYGDETYRVEAEVEQNCSRMGFDEMLVGLNKREKMLLQLMYKEDMNQKEAADAIGISPAMVSFMHKDLMARLRTKFFLKEKQAGDLLCE